MSSDPRTRVYVQRRSADGMSNKEIRRCLKRYIVRELYPFIIAGLGAKIRILDIGASMPRPRAGSTVSRTSDYTDFVMRLVQR